jgi:hypothetical protein
MVFRSSAGVVIGRMLNFSTGTSSTAGVRKAGSDGPTRMFVISRLRDEQNVAFFPLIFLGEQVQSVRV